MTIPARVSFVTLGVEDLEGTTRFYPFSDSHFGHANGRRRGLVPIEQGTPLTMSIDQEVVFGS